MSNKIVILTDEDFTTFGKQKYDRCESLTMDDFYYPSKLIEQANFVAYMPVSGYSMSMYVLKNRFGNNGWHHLEHDPELEKPIGL